MLYAIYCIVFSEHTASPTDIACNILYSILVNILQYPVELMFHATYYIVFSKHTAVTSATDNPCNILYSVM